MLLHDCTKHGNTKIASFHSNAEFHALPDFNHLLLHVFNIVDLQLVLTLLYDSLNLVIIEFISGLLGANSSEEMKLRVSRCSS